MCFHYWLMTFPRASSKKWHLEHFDMDSSIWWLVQGGAGWQGNNTTPPQCTLRWSLPLCLLNCTLTTNSPKQTKWKCFGKVRFLLSSYFSLLTLRFPVHWLETIEKWKVEQFLRFKYMRILTYFSSRVYFQSALNVCVLWVRWGKTAVGTR